MKKLDDFKGALMQELMKKINKVCFTRPHDGILFI